MADRSYHPQVCAGPDVEELLAEMQEARSLLGHVRALHHSGPGEELTGEMEEVGGRGNSDLLWRHPAGLTPFSFLPCQRAGLSNPHILEDKAKPRL